MHALKKWILTAPRSVQLDLRVLVSYAIEGTLAAATARPGAEIRAMHELYLHLDDVLDALRPDGNRDTQAASEPPSSPAE